MRRLWAALALGLLLAGCLRFDHFFFNGQPAAADANLMRGATAIPAELVEEVRGPIVAADGTVVDAYLARHRPGDGTPEARHGLGLLYCHGNARNIEEYAGRVQHLWEQGYTVLIFDYPGYGKMAGPSSEPGMYSAARAARAWLEGRADLGLSADKVALYGWSLGSAACTQLASERSPRALVLEAPIGSAHLFEEDALGVEGDTSWLFDGSFDNIAKIPRFTGALLVMHGQDDTFIRPEHGKRIHQAAEGHARPNLLWLPPGVGHGQVPCAPNTPNAVTATSSADCQAWNDEYLRQVNALYDGAYGTGP